MLTPNRNGISALPGDLFYTQVIDINYMAGLTWTRQPGLRVLFHPNKKVTFGFSVEQPTSTSAVRRAAPALRCPALLRRSARTATRQCANISAGQLSGATRVHAGLHRQARLRSSSRFHFEVGGIESNFKTGPVLGSRRWLRHTTTGRRSSGRLQCRGLRRTSVSCRTTSVAMARAGICSARRRI